MGLEEEGLSCWPGAAREGKAFTHLCVGGAEAEQEEQAKLGGGGTEERDCKTVCTPPVFSEEWGAVMNATD